MMDYAQVIKYLRKSNKLTQQNVADRLGIIKQQVYKYEKGIAGLNVKRLEQLLLIYGYKLVIIKEKEVYDK